MQRDVTNGKSTYTCYKKGIYCVNIVMETGYRFALKDTQSPLMERERTGTEPRKEDTSRSQNQPDLAPLPGANLRVAYISHH